MVKESTVAGRIVRAKRTLTEAHVPFEVPTGVDRTARLTSVLEVVYLIFNEGYSATAGDDWLRPELCADALRLVRILADQDRSRWDRLLIRRGLEALAKAERLGGLLGPYTLQAAIAATHARAQSVQNTDWVRIAALYDALAQLSPSPVVELNRAVAVSMAFGPEAGLEIVDVLTSEPSLATYHLLSSVRGDLLDRLGRVEEAHAEFERAASLARNQRERDLLLHRAESLGMRSTMGLPRDGKPA